MITENKSKNAVKFVLIAWETLTAIDQQFWIVHKMFDVY